MALLALLASAPLDQGCRRRDERLGEGDRTAVGARAKSSAPRPRSRASRQDKPRAARPSASLTARRQRSVPLTGSDGRWPDCDPEASTAKLTFVHVSDLHASYGPDSLGTSPYARLRGYVNQVREENPATIFTSAGDEHEKGSVAEVVSRGRATLEILPWLRYDVRTLGNHDFAWGLEGALAVSRDAHTSTLASNVRYLGRAGAFGARDFVALEVGCVRVGFVGLVPPPWSELDEVLSSSSYYPGLEVRYDFAERARELVAEHRAEVDVVVLLGHLGLATDHHIARAVPGIDVILGGHSHSLLTAPEREGETLIVHAGAFARHAARLDLEVELTSGRISSSSYDLQALSDPDLLADAATEASVRSVVQRYAPNAFTHIGCTTQSYEQRGVARLTALAAREALEADAALVEHATAWGSLRAGPVTPQACLDALPVELEPPGTTGFSSLYRTRVSGADLIRIRSAVASRQSYTGPKAPDPDATYTVALQKRSALHPNVLLPRGVHVAHPTYAMESWDALSRYVARRARDGLAADEDVPLAECSAQTDTGAPSSG